MRVSQVEQLVKEVTCSSHLFQISTHSPFPSPSRLNMAPLPLPQPQDSQPQAPVKQLQPQEFDPPQESQPHALAKLLQESDPVDPPEESESPRPRIVVLNMAAKLAYKLVIIFNYYFHCSFFKCKSLWFQKKKKCYEMFYNLIVYHSFSCVHSWRSGISKLVRFPMMKTTKQLRLIILDLQGQYIVNQKVNPNRSILINNDFIKIWNRQRSRCRKNQEINQYGFQSFDPFYS